MSEMEPRIPTRDVTTQGDGGAFGRRLREARKRAGYRTLRDLADAVGMHKMTVHKHEHRLVVPSPKAVAAYARVLGVSEVYLLHGIDDKVLEAQRPPPLPPAVVRYLDSVDGKGLDPDIADRLRRVPWSMLIDGEVERWQVHEVRKLIAKNLSRRASSLEYAERSNPTTLQFQFVSAR